MVAALLFVSEPYTTVYLQKKSVGIYVILVNTFAASQPHLWLQLARPFASSSLQMLQGRKV